MQNWHEFVFRYHPGVHGSSILLCSYNMILIKNYLEKKLRNHELERHKEPYNIEIWTRKRGM